MWGGLEKPGPMKSKSVKPWDTETPEMNRLLCEAIQIGWNKSLLPNINLREPSIGIVIAGAGQLVKLRDILFTSQPWGGFGTECNLSKRLEKFKRLPTFVRAEALADARIAGKRQKKEKADESAFC